MLEISYYGHGQQVPFTTCNSYWKPHMISKRFNGSSVGENFFSLNVRQHNAAVMIWQASLLLHRSEPRVLGCSPELISSGNCPSTLSLLHRVIVLSNTAFFTHLEGVQGGTLACGIVEMPRCSMRASHMAMPATRASALGVTLHAFCHG